jgi:sugar phosphate isomerase/epimerase
VIFVSTGGRSGQKATTTALEYYSRGIINVELSGGSISPPGQEGLGGLPKDMCVQIHNYFPPPAEPFVFNLASSDATTTARSLALARNAIRLAVSLGRPKYSFHAGFRIDPRASELGQTLLQRNMLDRGRALEIFGERIAMLAEEARSLGAVLLIENNVLTQPTLSALADDPLLFTSPNEIITFMEGVPSNVRLLLDVAHLKVTARTLGFDPLLAHESLRPWIGGYHLSDNDGKSDSNDPISEDSWFWGCLVRGLDYYSIEVYRTTVDELVEQCRIASKMLSVPSDSKSNV